jgi:putative NADPH-quinone reductase
VTTRTLLILGHPSPDSFNAALANAYADAARQAGRELRRIDLHALNFDPILHGSYRGEQPLEPDLG